MGDPTDRTRIAALDGVRGLAVLVVIVHNAAWVSGESRQFVTKLFGAAAAAGWVGVQLFFVLSGLLITGILLDTRGRPGFFRTFYLRRSLRIFPLYFAVVGATVFLAAPLASDVAWAARVRAEQWAYWLYVANWTQSFGHGISGLTHLWSLAVEEQFYLLWPLLVWWLGARGLGRLALLMVLAGPLVRIALVAAGLPVDASYEFTIARWDALAAGALLAIWLRDTTARAVVIRWRTRVTVVAATLLIAVVLMQRGLHQQDWLSRTAGQSLTAVLSACLLAWTIADSSGATPRIARVFAASWLQNLGHYSYALYLLHFPIHRLLLPRLVGWVQHADDLWHLPRVIAYLALVFALSYVGARITWRLIEQPCLALKARWAPRAE